MTQSLDLARPWQLGMIAFVGACSVSLVIALPLVALAVPSPKPNAQ